MAIVKFKKSANSYACLICGSKENMVEMAIERDHSNHSSVIGFTICVECAKQMAEELNSVDSRN